MAAQKGAYLQHAMRNRARTAANMDRMADLVADGWTISAAGRHIGFGEGRSLQVWKQIKTGLGPQAI